jgi:hypothetical protein
MQMMSVCVRKACRLQNEREERETGVELEVRDCCRVFKEVDRPVFSGDTASSPGLFVENGNAIVPIVVAGNTIPNGVGTFATPTVGDSIVSGNFVSFMGIRATAAIVGFFYPRQEWDWTHYVDCGFVNDCA